MKVFSTLTHVVFFMFASISVNARWAQDERNEWWTQAVGELWTQNYEKCHRSEKV